MEFNLDGVEIRDGIRVLIRTRYENVEEDNKYWMKKNVEYGFCEQDKLEYYVEDYVKNKRMV